ncbi:unnamed protein product [Hermetia illucens]|uniref:Uncharacterized protein n=1 Tax=Hermetia illucens TaxID=343691 RepID=A0A7R8UHD4_HERIL|nr:unnamed protein product [Hermetia illucens]
MKQFLMNQDKPIRSGGNNTLLFTRKGDVNGKHIIKFLSRKKSEKSNSFSKETKGSERRYQPVVPNQYLDIMSCHPSKKLAMVD